MKIKTYRSESVNKALEQIRKELGPDAVILKTKRTRKRRLMGLVPALAYEITAASESSRNARDTRSRPRDTYEVSDRPPRPVPPGLKRRGALKVAHTAGGDTVLPEDRLKPHMSKLTAEIEEIKRMVSNDRNAGVGGLDLSILEDGWDWSTGTGLSVDWKAAKEAVRELRRLISDGVDETLAHTLVKFAVREFSKTPEDQTDLRAHLNRAVRNMVQTSADRDPPDWGRRISVFIGPTGVGKTTTIAKLAATFALGEHRKVQLITFDTYRIAAAEQLKTYADIIGVPIRTASTVEGLRNAIDESQDRDRVLIDTTGTVIRERPISQNCPVS